MAARSTDDAGREIIFNTENNRWEYLDGIPYDGTFMHEEGKTEIRMVLDKIAQKVEEDPKVWVIKGSKFHLGWCAAMSAVKGLLPEYMKKEDVND